MLICRNFNAIDWNIKIQSILFQFVYMVAVDLVGARKIVEVVVYFEHMPSNTISTIGGSTLTKSTVILFGKDRTQMFP